VRAQARLYDRLFKSEHPSQEGDDFLADLNPQARETIDGALVEPALAGLAAGERFQLERVGYFCIDPDSRPGAPVLNRTIGLRDSWAAKQAK
jgi:glutaminyl-tRNA synthetase